MSEPSPKPRPRTRSVAPAPVQEIAKAAPPAPAKKPKKGKAAKETKPKEEEAPKSEIEALRDKLDKQYGLNIIVKGSMLPLFSQVSLGPFTMDLATLGGYPEGKGLMFVGWEGSGKTTNILRAIAGLQMKHPEGLVAYFDLEFRLDRVWAMKHGVDLDRLLVIHPTTGEEAVDIAYAMMRTKEVIGIAMDSIPALIPTISSDRSAEDTDAPAENARLVNKFIRAVYRAWGEERKRNHHCTVIAANQFRHRITQYGDPRSIPGGNFLKFMMENIIELKNKELMKNEVFKRIKGGSAEEAPKEKENGANETSVNEHSFLFRKAKLTSIRSGEFKMVVDPEHPQGMGTFLDAPTVVAHAKRVGFVTGGGASWRVQGVPAMDEYVFRTLDEISNYLYENDEDFLELKRGLIVDQRLKKDLPALPPDGFLLKHV